jgi:hypothetical protein
MREVSLHILDVARNSVEAGAAVVDLEIIEDTAADLLRVTIRDDGPGMDAATVARATDPFYSTRTTRRIGMGLSLMKATCERCEGSLSVHSVPGQGTVVEATLKLSHLDRPPLGDMGAVIQALACEAGSVALRYAHEVDGRSFELDTAEIQQELDGVPICNAMVLQWLRRLVDEELQELGSRA